MLAGNIFQQLYNTVDTIVVGRYEGKNAIAAVSTSFPMFFMLLALVFGMNMGAGVVISQFFGAGKLEQVRRAVTTLAVFQFFCVLVMSPIGLMLSEPIFRLMKVPPEIMQDSLAYARIFFYGLVFMFGYNLLAGILRAIGDSRTPLIFLIISALTNIVLDIYFVASLGWGVAGVAWATLISQCLSMILCFIYISRKIPLLSFTVQDIVFDREILQSMIRLAIPSSLQQMVVSMGFMTVQSLVNSFGTVTMAAFSAAGRVDSFATMPIQNFGGALSTFAGQNVGAWKLERISEGVRSTLMMSLLVCLFTTTLAYTAGPYLIEIFLDAGLEENREVIAQGVDYIKTVTMFYFLFALSATLNGVLRGSGDTFTPMASSFFSLSVRIIVAYSLTSMPGVGYRGLWWSLPCGWLAGCVIPSIRYLSGTWKNRARQRYESIMNLTGSDPLPLALDLVEP